jgi:uncharacterized protein (DUF2141 family)
MILKLAAILSLLSLPAVAATVTVTVNKVKVAKGDIRASICENEQAYKADTCIKDAVVKAEKGSTTLVFEDIAPGTYGIQLFHDKNGNGDMDFNFLGFPKESFGFSNWTKFPLSQPQFKKISFPVTDKDMSLSIDLIN